MSLERWHDLPSMLISGTPQNIAEILIHNYLSRYVPTYIMVDGKRKKATACNILFTDIVQQLRLPGPYHWVDKKGNPLRYSKDAHVKGSELSANGLVDWFRLYGQSYGWKRVNREDAHQYAKESKLVAVTYYAVPIPNEPPSSGHIAILLPNGNIAQAGNGMPFVDKSLETGFGKLPVEFWVYLK